MLIILTLIGTALAFLGPISNSPFIPQAHAAPPNNPAILGFFNEAAKSNAVAPGAASGTVTYDVNVTDAGSLKGFDINITYASASLTLSQSSFSGSLCPASDVAIFGTPTSGAALKTDAGNHIRFYDIPLRGIWVPGDSVIYDTNGDGKFTTGKFYNDTIITGIAPANKTTIPADTALKFVGAGTSWVAGNPIVLDPNGNNLYDTAKGCLFDRLNSNKLVNVTATLPSDSTKQTYRLSVVDSDTQTPFVNGFGILFRIIFTIHATQATTIHITTNRSVIQNPASVPYNQIDGYFDNRASPSTFPISVSPTSLTVLRTVSGTNTTSATVTLGAFSGVTNVTLKALSLPLNTVASFSQSFCTAACSRTVTFTVSGGPKGGAGTTPSGTYFIPIIGNSTAGGSPSSGIVRSTWLTLIVKPPKAPVFTLTVTPTSFTQEAGNYTTLDFSVTLSSGASDAIAMGDNCINRLQGGACVEKPNAGSFNLIGKANVTTNPSSTTPGLYRFNITATTQGTYSEVVQTLNATIRVTVLKTHDVAVQGIGIGTRNFAYNGVSATCPSLCPASPSGGTLKTDAKIKYIDSNNNNVWDSGEAVVYDSNSNSLYNVGEPMIAGTSALVGQALKTDAKVKYVDGNNNNVWDSGEYVVYDSNANNVYDSGEPAIGGPGQLQISVPVANLGTASETFVVNSTARVVLSNNDCRLGFVDANSNHLYDTGEVIVLDSDCNGRYGSGTIDPRMRFVGPGTTWASGNAIVIDADSSGTFDLTAPLVDKAIANSPTFGQSLTLDTNVKFVDSNVNGVWDPGEAVVYDSNGNSIYDTGEPVIAGSPVNGASLSLDTQIKFVDSNSNGIWNAGEPVGYDTNNNGAYDPDWVVSGATPANGTAVKFDSHILFVDTGDVILSGTPSIGQNLKTDSHVKFVNATNLDTWVSGKAVVGDANNNGVYDSGEPVISGVAPSVGTKIKNDPLLKFVDTNGNGVWDSGESVVYDTNLDNQFNNNLDTVWDPWEAVFYDSNANFVYNSGDTLVIGNAPTLETILVGVAPPLGTSLASEKLSYPDTNFNAVWDSGESIVGDTNANGLFEGGEPVPVPGSSPPSPGLLLGSQSITLSGGASMTVLLGWNPGSLPRGKYLIGSAAVPVTNEFNLGNNAVLSFSFTQKFKGDVSGDCHVDIVDLATVGSTFGKTFGQAGYNAAADLNNDGVINIVDLVLVAGVFGQSC